MCVCDQEKERTSVKTVKIPKEQKSSERELVIDVSPLEDKRTFSKQFGTTTKDLSPLRMVNSLIKGP